MGVLLSPDHLTMALSRKMFDTHAARLCAVNCQRRFTLSAWGSFAVRARAFHALVDLVESRRGFLQFLRGKYIPPLLGGEYRERPCPIRDRFCAIARRIGKHGFHSFPIRQMYFTYLRAALPTAVTHGIDAT